MNRRSFLGLLGGLGAASATSYFFAPIGGWKSDVIVHPRWNVTETSPGEFTSWIDDPRNERCIKEAMGISLAGGPAGWMADRVLKNDYIAQRPGIGPKLIDVWAPDYRYKGFVEGVMSGNQVELRPSHT